MTPRKRPYKKIELPVYFKNGAKLSPEQARANALVEGLSLKLIDPKTTFSELDVIRDSVPDILKRLKQLETDHDVSETPSVPTELSMDEWRQALSQRLLDPKTPIEELEQIRTAISNIDSDSA